MTRKGTQTSQRRNNRDPIQERKVAAYADHDLESDDDNSCGIARHPRPENKPRRNQLSEVIEKGADLQHAAWQEVKPPTQTVRNRLRLEVIRKRGEIAPAFVTANFDETGTEHDLENQ